MKIIFLFPTMLQVACFIFLLLIGIYNLLDKMRNKRRWDLLEKIPGRKPLPIVGNFMDLISFKKHDICHLARYFQYRHAMAELFRKEKMNIMWIGSRPLVFLTAPESIAPILNSTTEVEKGFLYKFIKPWVGQGLGTSSGDIWRQHRKFLNLTFHSQKLSKFLPIMNKNSSVLVQKINARNFADDGLDAFELYSSCSLGTLCDTLFGLKLNDEDESNYLKNVQLATEAIMFRSARPWLHSDFVYFKTNHGKSFQNMIRSLHYAGDKIIAERKFTKNAMAKSEATNSEDEVKKRKVMLDLLLDLGCSEDVIKDQIRTFMVVGHDTTAVSLTWISYLIGLYPKIQEKLLDEIDRVFGDDRDRPATEHDLKGLRYLEMVIKEGLRLYTVTPFITRKLQMDMEICGYVIPEGTECYLSVYSMHHNSDHYPNPEVFDPERFSPENSAGRHPCAFIPFSVGIRNCLGQRFAWYGLKIILSHVLRNFRLQSLEQPDKITIFCKVLLKPEKPIRVKFIPRTSLHA